MDPAVQLGSELLVGGAFTFLGVFIAARLAYRQERYAKHVDSLRSLVLARLDPPLVEVTKVFSEFRPGSLDLEAYTQRWEPLYPDNYAPFLAWPSSRFESHVFELAMAHWPDLLTWKEIQEFGTYGWHAAILHQPDLDKRRGIYSAELARSLAIHLESRLHELIAEPEPSGSCDQCRSIAPRRQRRKTPEPAEIRGWDDIFPPSAIRLRIAGLMHEGQVKG